MSCCPQELELPAMIHLVVKFTGTPHPADIHYVTNENVRRMVLSHHYPKSNYAEQCPDASAVSDSWGPAFFRTFLFA
jgi:hypothetical protein